MNFYEIGAILTVSGRSITGKNRCKLYGDKWEITEDIGNDVMLRPISDDGYVPIQRICSKENDEDFTILSSSAVRREIRPTSPPPPITRGEVKKKGDSTDDTLDELATFILLGMLFSD